MERKSPKKEKGDIAFRQFSKEEIQMGGEKPILSILFMNNTNSIECSGRIKSFLRETIREPPMK